MRLTFATMLSIKAGVIFALLLCLLVPLALIEGTIAERQNLHESVQSQIADSWGSQQTVIGPILVIPYRSLLKQASQVDQDITKLAVFLPETVESITKLNPEVRYRGIYQAVVYSSEITLKGTFQVPTLEKFREIQVFSDERIFWDSAFVTMGFTDLKRMKGDLKLDWDGKNGEFFPGSLITSLVKNGIHSPVPIQNSDHGKSINFSTDFKLDGSRSMAFIPIGKSNHVEIISSWLNPSFMGSILPDTREVSSDGFKAIWDVSYFSRGFPQFFSSDQLNMDFVNSFETSQFGVNFYQPMTAYRLSERSAKYGILFLLFTFAVFFLFEVVMGVAIHIFQYGLIGVSLLVFFLLLLALSEQIGFTIAYWAASIAVLSQVAIYSFNVLKSLKRAFVMASVMALLYLYLFIVLHLEDYALILGSVGLFASITLVMIATRRVNWFSDSLKASE